MSNKRITDLTELTNPTTDDVFPVVDIATNTTTKVQLGNLPVPSSVTTALATKQDSLVSGTNIKTINSTSVLGSGDIAVQETLVSGVSLKTVNSTSLLGSGDIPIPIVTPSGVSGAIQFTDGSAFASDAANLFWDDANNRLGVGTNAPTKELTIDANSTDGGLIIRSQTDQLLFQVTKDGNSVSTSELFQYVGGAINFALRSATNASYFNNGTFTFGATTNLGAKVNIKGSGSTSATTSLLVQNSAGTQTFKVQDDGDLFFSGLETSPMRIHTQGNANKGITVDNEIDIGAFSGITFKLWDTSAYSNFMRIVGNTANRALVIGGTTNDASAILQIDSTSKGFLPPRMTTTQKNAIASPATGLVLYDSTTNKLQCYNGSTWNDLF
jgi:hypothetical protein